MYGRQTFLYRIMEGLPVIQQVRPMLPRHYELEARTSK